MGVEELNRLQKHGVSRRGYGRGRLMSPTGRRAGRAKTCIYPLEYHLLEMKGVQKTRPVLSCLW